MIAFAFIDSQGCPTGGGSQPSLPEGAVALPSGFGTEDLARLMWLGGTWKLRPVLPKPARTVDGLAIDGMPTGSGMVVNRLGSTDQWVPVVVDGAAVVSLPDNGTFRAVTFGASPWLGNEITIVRGSGSPELAAAALLRAKDVARTRINDAIGKTRLKYVTDLPGQPTIYTEKQAEARAYLRSDPLPPTLVDYPRLSDEVGLTAPTAWQLAQVWVNNAVLSSRALRITEKLRMQASFAIDAATTEAAVEAAVYASLTTLAEGPLG